jgi:hypothetical protein
MDNGLLATIITVGGTIVVAIITGLTTLITELIKIGKIPPDSTWRWTRTFGYPIALLIIVVVGSLVFYLQYDGTTSRLTKELPSLPFHTKRIYPNVGLGLLYPQKWEVEDYAFRFGGGDMGLIRARSDDRHFETQGVSIGIGNIAEHHWNDPESEFRHVEDGLKDRCVQSGWSRGTISIANGRQAALFKCESLLKSGGRRLEQIIWYQLSRCLRLRIRSWSTLGGEANTVFNQEFSQFLNNMRLDDVKILALINNKQTSCEGGQSEAAKS